MRISTNMQDDIKKVLLTEEQIKKRVKEMGEQLSKEYMDNVLRIFWKSMLVAEPQIQMFFAIVKSSLVRF